MMWLKTYLYTHLIQLKTRGNFIVTSRSVVVRVKGYFMSMILMIKDRS